MKSQMSQDVDVFLSNGVEAAPATLYALSANIAAGLEGRGGRRARPHG
jgi:hypothetical protein